MYDRLRKLRAVQSVDEPLQRLAAAKSRWAALTPSGIALLLEEVRERVHAVAPEWVAAATEAKGLRPGSALAGEEWISGPWAVLYALNRYLRSLRQIESLGRPALPRSALRVVRGRSVLDVFPGDRYDRLLLHGIRAEVRLLPGVAPEAALGAARQIAPGGRLALVLGAGNIASIPPLDVLYKLLADGAVCMLKMNPVNAYLAPFFERLFAPLIEQGFVAVCCGGAQLGAELCAHPLVDEIHVTGSERTHDAILFGTGADAAERKAQDRPVLDKPVTSELGNVSPTIVVPGDWSHQDLLFQAVQIATQKAHNAGFNCIASQVLILPREWEHTAPLRAAIQRVFDEMEQRPEYYPGAPERRTALAGEGSPLRTVLQVDPADTGHPAFSKEAFCGVLACVELPGDPQRFLTRAVAFANERLHGTLGANLVVHPRTERAMQPQIDTALDDLRYGCVAVNAWTGLGYLIAETPWGAYPGNARNDAGSGIGVVHNAYFLAGTQKSVVRAPFAPFPRSLRTGERTLLPLPPWFVTNRNGAQIGRLLCDFEYARTPVNALRVASAALGAG